MGLKNKWKPLVDGVDDASAVPINQIAEAVIETEDQIGDIDTALDAILEIQTNFTGEVEVELPGDFEEVLP